MSHKSFFKALLMGALALTGSAVFAQTMPDPAPLVADIYLTRQVEKFCLSIGKQANTLAFVQLLAPGGEELYSASLPRKGTSFRQLFDLNELKDGTYTIRIQQGKSVIVKSIQLQTKAPEQTIPSRMLIVGN